MAKLTLFGMARYMEEHNDDLFESFSQLPEGVDKATLIDVLMLEGGEFQVLYTDPYFLKNRITYWMSKHKRTFDKWMEALNLEYEPLWNYDRHEEWTDHNEGETTRTDSNTMTGGNSSEVVETLTGTGTKASTNVIDEETSNIIDEDTTTTGESESSATESTTTSTSNTTTNTVSAYNSSVYEPDNKSEVVGSGTTSGTSSGTTESSTTGTRDETDTFTRDETDTYNENTSQNSTDRTVTTGTNNQTNTGSGSGTSENDSTHDGHLYGNIGITTSQTMLKEQLEVVTWNIYSHIADLFISEFCITLYF